MDFLLECSLFAKPMLHGHVCVAGSSLSEFTLSDVAAAPAFEAAVCYPRRHLSGMSLCCLGEPDTRTPFLTNMSLVTARPVFYCLICKCRAEWNGIVQPKPVPHHFNLKTAGFGNPTHRHSSALTSMTRSVNSGEVGPAVHS